MVVFVLGGTGLVGTQFVQSAIEAGIDVVSLARRIPTPFKDNAPANFKAIINTDLKTWPEEIKNYPVPAGSTYFSSFGTTRRDAGSAEKFKELDYGTNIEALKAAKANGNFDTAILVSSMGADPNASFLYMKTKGELERDFKALGFKRTVILRPGILLGVREAGKEKNMANTVAEKVGAVLRGTFLDGVIGHPIRADEVALASRLIAESPIDEQSLLVLSSKEIRDIAARGTL